MKQDPRLQGQDRDKTGTRQGQDRDETGTRQDQDRDDKTGTTRQRKVRGKTRKIQGQDKGGGGQKSWVGVKGGGGR